MKQLFFRLKSYIINKAAYTAFIFNVKQYAAQKLRKPKSQPISRCRLDIAQGLVLSAYICSLYRHKSIDFWRMLLFASTKKIRKIRPELAAVIDQSFADGFVYEPEYLLARKVAIYIIYTLTSRSFIHSLTKIPFLYLYFRKGTTV